MGFGFPGPYRLSRLPKPGAKDEIECPEGGVPEIVTLSEPPEFRVLEVFDEPVHTLGRVGVGVGVTLLTVNFCTHLELAAESLPSLNVKYPFTCIFVGYFPVP